MPHQRIVPTLMCASSLVVLRALDPAAHLGIGTARSLGVALTTLFLATALATAWQATRGRRPADRRQHLRLAAVAGAFLALALVLGGGLRIGTHASGLSTGHAFGPFTVWPSVSFAAPLVPLTGFFTLGRFALLATSAILVALAAHLMVESLQHQTRCPRTMGVLGMGGGLGTVGCPACSLIPLIIGGGTTAGAIVAWNPGSPLAAALDTLAVVGPLAVVLAQTRGRTMHAAGTPKPPLPPRRFVLPTMVAVPAVVAILGMPEGDSSRQQAVHDFYVATLIGGTLLTLIALGILIGFAIKYRERDHDHGRRDHELTRGRRRAIQSAYIGVPVLVIFGLGIFSYALLMDMEDAPEADQRIDVVANRFAWHFTYPDGSTSLNELRVRSGDAVHLNLSSPDVIHSLFIPDMGVKIDAMPGVVTHAWFEPTGEGTYPAYCVEYCGVGHASMRANLIVYPASGPQPTGDEGRGAP